MKNSGIEWIGEIPDSWEVNLVKNIFDITRGRVIAKTEIEDEPLENYYPVYSSQTANSGILGYIPSYDFAVDSLTWTTDGAKAGTVFLRRGKYSITNVCGILTLKSKKYSLDYLNYAVGFSAYNCRRADINGYKIMSNEMAIIPIVVPYLEEQQRIAKHLDEKCGKIDDLIANQQAQIEKLKEYKQSVITEAVTKGLDKSAPLKYSGIEWIGAISTNAKMYRLKNVANILDEFRQPITADLRNQNANILYDYYGASGAIDKIDGYTIDDHVMLIGEDGANLRMRNLPLMYEVNGKAWINNHAHILKPKKNILFKYLFLALESLDINPYITGSAQPKLNQENLKNIWLPVFSIEEQQQIIDYLDEKCEKIDQLIAIKQEKIEKLQEYKKSLIYEYVTGKKEVV